MNTACRVLVPSLVLFLASPWAQGASLPLELVSPGDSQRSVEIADHCPTFNWGSDVRATSFELVIYRLSAEELPRSVGVEEVEPVLRVTVPGAARGWTPSLDQCLKPGGSYAWTLRALAEDVPSKWADPRMFTVGARPTVAAVEAALDVLNLYVERAQRGEADPLGPQVAGEEREPRTKTLELGAAAGEAGTGPSAPEGTGIAAIRGEISDPTGETYGVEGISSSPGGAGLSAENTADATDLLLRGDGVAPDAGLTESTLDRSSGSDQTFDIRNSGTGAMTLQVDGADVVTTLTDSDTLGSLACSPTQIAKWNGATWQCVADENDDTLGGLSCAATQVAQWDGGAWVCASTGTDTLASLSCGPGQVVHWNGSAWVCGQPTLTHVSCSGTFSCSVACPAGSIVWTGGCTAFPGSATLINSAPTSAGAGLPPTGWACGAFNPLGSSTVTVDLYCASQ